jgi:hypothetical protein
MAFTHTKRVEIRSFILARSDPDVFWSDSDPDLTNTGGDNLQSENVKFYRDTKVLQLQLGFFNV